MLQETPNSDESLSHSASDIAQAGAICLRQGRKGPEILFVGSRRNGRWGLPKGPIVSGESSWTAAKREAFEEAGIVGDIENLPIGSFTYYKDTSPYRYRVTVHLVNTRKVKRIYPEKLVRKVKWFPLKGAAAIVGQPGLRDLLGTLALHERYR
jgi:8-oxo-dGTP pyrophosphatase MutT (NUDIX family)